jgi:hypothetical protein
MATIFPFNLATLASLKDTSGHVPRFNMKADGTYNITTSIVMASQGPLTIQGYSSAIGDFGRATIDAGVSTISIWNDGSLNNFTLADLTVQNNGASSNNHGFLCSGQNHLFLRCVANNIRGDGFVLANSCGVIECEAYSCNQSNTSGLGGFSLGTSASFAISCIAHDNSGNLTDGFTSSGSAAGAIFLNCIADTNGRHGFSVSVGSNNQLVFSQCDSYNNVADGLSILNTTLTSNLTIRNSNFIKNGGWGINTAITTARLNGAIDNCGFGSGSQVNTSGQTNNVDAVIVRGSVTYASGATPWVDPANGNFSVNLPAAMNAGRGAFTETATSYAGTIGYPVIGAAQSNTITQSPAWAGGDFILPVGYLTHAYLYEWAFSTNTSFALQSGSLPPGLTLTTLSTTTAEIAGTPTTIGIYNFVLRATVGTSTGDATFHITVNADPDEGIGGLLGGLRPTC